MPRVWTSLSKEEAHMDTQVLSCLSVTALASVGGGSANSNFDVTDADCRTTPVMSSSSRLASWGTASTITLRYHLSRHTGLAARVSDQRREQVPSWIACSASRTLLDSRSSTCTAVQNRHARHQVFHPRLLVCGHGTRRAQQCRHQFLEGGRKRRMRAPPIPSNRSEGDTKRETSEHPAPRKTNTMRQLGRRLHEESGPLLYLESVVECDRREVLHVVKRQVELLQAGQRADPVQVANPACRKPQHSEV